MSQQGWPRGPHSGQQDDWWSQLYDPGSPDTGSSRSGDTLDDRYASVRRTMGSPSAPGRGQGARTGGRRARTEPEPERREEPVREVPVREEPPGEEALPEPELEPEPVRKEEPVWEAEPDPDDADDDWEWTSDQGDPLPGRPPADPHPDPRPDPRPGPRPDPRVEGGPLTRRAASAPSARTEAQAETEAASETEAEPGAAQVAGPAGDFGRAELFERTDADADAADAQATATDDTVPDRPEPPLRPGHVGERPPTYDAEPATFPAAEPSSLSELVPDTVLDGAHYGGLTLRAASLRGDSARHRGALRRDALLTARFGSGESALLLVAVAAGGRSATGGHRAAREICQSIGGAVGRSHVRLAEDIRADRRGALKSGLQRLTDRCYGKLRAQAAALELQPEEYTADLRCLLVSADPRCSTRVFFGAGAGGVFRLRSGEWYDIENGPREQVREQGPEQRLGQGPGRNGGSSLPGGAPGTDPAVNELDASELGDPAALSIPVRKPTGKESRARQPDDTLRLGLRVPGPPGLGSAGHVPSAQTPPGAVPPGPVTSGLPTSGPPTVADPGGAAVAPPLPPPARPEPEPFRFCATVARSGDRLLLCSPGLAEPLRAEPAFAGRLAQSWSEPDEPPGLAAFLADVQLRVRGFADDRTAVAVWEGQG